VVKEVVFAVPGDLATPTGGYVYDRRMIAELAALGWRTRVLDLGNSFPRPSEEARAAAAERLTLLPRHSPIVIDGLAFGVLPQTAQVLRDTHRLVALVHHPLALETGLSVEEAASLRASEQAALACARHVVATSATTERMLGADFAVPLEHLSMVAPGTDRVARRPRERAAMVRLLAVGSVIPRKGYDVLIAALAKVAHLPWRLLIVGDCSRSPATTAQLKADIARLGLEERVALCGAVSADELAPLYQASDLFVLPSRFEGYGMAFTEAIAHGLPVIGTQAGAIPETVPPEAGILVPPDDVGLLAHALAYLLERPERLEKLAVGASCVSFPSWREQGARFACVLEGVA
jgi:glycosyltransferase involved in cell wall biosynthesis